MCCGNKRPQLGSQTGFVPQAQPRQQQIATSLASAPQTTLASRPSAIVFEYVGRTGLTVISPTTGNRYRFDAPGAQVAVDPRDRWDLIKIPLLKRVRLPRTL